MASRVGAYVKLLRPEIAAMDFALPASSALLASYLLTAGLPPIFPFLLAVIGGYCAIASTYVFNDCCDIDIDKINLPDRALASGDVSRRSALWYAFFLFLVALAVALYLNPECVAVLILATIAISVYSAVAKRATFLSFLPVGFSYGLVPIGIWLAFDPAGVLKSVPGDDVILPLPAIFLGAMICITDWGFTLSGVARDVEGDRLRGAPTFPVTFGVQMTSKFVMVCWTLGVALSLAIGYTAGLGLIYFAGAAIGGIWMLLQAADFVRNPVPERGGRLFLQASHYRFVIFLAMIADVVAGVTLAVPPAGSFM
ncbi:MAG: UbiA prenyltransferase family protein [Methanosarcinales archaeon]|nr:UbiA prenyltransferase family protein [Methanosarcinales archaeon]